MLPIVFTKSLLEKKKETLNNKMNWLYNCNVQAAVKLSLKLRSSTDFIQKASKT